MIALWIVILATVISVMLIIRFVGNAVRHLRFADQLADQFVDAMDQITKDSAYPQEMVEFLFEMGKNVDSFAFAAKVGYRFACKKQPSQDEAERARGFMQALDKLDQPRRNRFLEVMAIFLASLSYRDPFFGVYIREAMLGTSRQKTVTRVSVALVPTARSRGRLAHA